MALTEFLISKARLYRSALGMQEPSPFSHVSGMKNRFETLIQGLRAAGDDVMVFTPDRSPPAEYHGARVRPIVMSNPSCLELRERI